MYPNRSITSQLLSQRRRGGIIDALFQNSRRLEHDDATRRNRRLIAGLGVMLDTPISLETRCHSSVSLQFSELQLTGKCASQHRNASLLHASVYKKPVIRN